MTKLLRQLGEMLGLAANQRSTDQVLEACKVLRNDERRKSLALTMLARCQADLADEMRELACLSEGLLARRWPDNWPVPEED